MTEAEQFQNDFFSGRYHFGSYGIQLLSAPLLAACRPARAIPGYHVFMTSPRMERWEKNTFSMSRYELLTMQLSARLWKQYNGPIYLVADYFGEEYIRRQGMDAEYSAILHLPESTNGVNLKKFWAVGKIAALSALDTSCAIIDLDLIVWQPLPLADCKLAAAHIEHLTDRYYPPKEHFMMSPRYQFPTSWDWTSEPLNTAFLYINDEPLKETYTRESLRFMRSERDTPDDGTVCMIFAEQRILAMCAKEYGIAPKVFVDYDHMQATQPWFTHLWGGKHLINRYDFLQEELCRLCENKLRESSALSERDAFPEAGGIGCT